jgi:hypothetical protein
MGYTKRVNRSKGKGRSRARSRKGGDDVDKTFHVEDGFGPHKTEQHLMEEGRSRSPPNVTISPVTVKTNKYNPKGDEKVGGKRRKTRRGRKSKKHYKKGSASKTRKGRKDFVTHKGDKKYHRRGHRQSKPQKRKSMLAKLLGL